MQLKHFPMIAVFVITLLSGFSSKSNAEKTDLDYSNYSCQQMEKRYEVLHSEIKIIIADIAPSTTEEEVSDFLLSRVTAVSPISPIIHSVLLLKHNTLAEVPEINSRVSELKRIADTPTAGKCTGVIDKIEKLRKVLGDELEREKRNINDTALIR